MNENLEDNGQFKMRLDEEVEETPIPTDVDDLRIEKLSHRITMITILIPVLLVVVAVIAYMDIKKRVIQTEDSGQLTAENLSKDLESRFEKLTMAQQLVEENLARLKDQSDQSVAKVQINLKKLDDRLKKLDDGLKSTGRKMVSQKDMKATTAKLDQNVVNVAKSIEELKLEVAQITEILQPRITELQTALAENKTQLGQLNQNLSAIEEEKIGKDALDLALKLEVLKIKQAQKAQVEELQSKIKALERKIKRPAPAAAPPKPAAAPPKPAATQPLPSTSPQNKRLQEQTIGQ